LATEEAPDAHRSHAICAHPAETAAPEAGSLAAVDAVIGNPFSVVRLFLVNAHSDWGFKDFNTTELETAKREGSLARKRSPGCRQAEQQHSANYLELNKTRTRSQSRERGKTANRFDGG